LKNVWINRDTGHIRPEAFQRRPPFDGRERDASGLSVVFDAASAGSHYARGRACSLHVGHVRDIETAEIDVVQDSPHHANITGLPGWNGDPATIEFLSGELAEQARLVSDT
jgi:hypothetical protein